METVESQAQSLLPRNNRQFRSCCSTRNRWSHSIQIRCRAAPKWNLNNKMQNCVVIPYLYYIIHSVTWPRRNKRRWDRLRRLVRRDRSRHSGWCQIRIRCAKFSTSPGERLNETIIFPTDFSEVNEIKSPSFCNYFISNLCCISFSSSHFPVQLRNLGLQFLRSHYRRRKTNISQPESFIFTNLI